MGLVCSCTDNSLKEEIATFCCERDKNESRDWKIHGSPAPNGEFVFQHRIN
jgi:hypothetical protein